MSWSPPVLSFRLFSQSLVCLSLSMFLITHTHTRTHTHTHTHIPPGRLSYLQFPKLHAFSCHRALSHAILYGLTSRLAPFHAFQFAASIFSTHITSSNKSSSHIPIQAHMVPTLLYHSTYHAALQPPVYSSISPTKLQALEMPGMCLFKNHCRGFPGGAVVGSLPANAGDTGSSPGLGRSHMPRSN